MPTKRTRRRPVRRFDARRPLNESQRRRLLTGHGWFRDDFADDADMMSAWREWEDELTEEYAETHPGYRPFMWWVTIGVPTYGERPIVWSRFQDGYRDNWTSHFNILHTNTIPPIQEPEPEFLYRCGVLSFDEWEAYQRGAGGGAGDVLVNA